jgi:SAM-dependent methyltransferase
MLSLETLKKPLRKMKRLLRRERLDATATPSMVSTIVNEYSHAAPSLQEAVNIFSGEWASKFPTSCQIKAGQIGLFEDERIRMGLASLGSIAGQRVLELGPLEGGHSYMLEQAGAREVVAIEANTRAYLKCLIAKEILGMQRVKFLCGDFMTYLRHSPPRFDFVLASGVLYHQTEPVELLQRLARITDRLLLWTHYFDEALVRRIPHFRDNFQITRESRYAGFTHVLHQQEYGPAIHNPGFCGAGCTYSYWLERQTILDALKHVGFSQVTVLQDLPEFANGPYLLVAARR